MYTCLVLCRNPTDPPALSSRRESSPQGMQDSTHLRGKSHFWLVFGTLLCQVPADVNLHCQRRALYIGKTMNQGALEQGPTPTPALLFGFGRSLLPSGRGNNWRFEDQSQSCPTWLCRCVSPAGLCPAGNCSQAKPVYLQGVVGFGEGQGVVHMDQPYHKMYFPPGTACTLLIKSVLKQAKSFL